MAMISDDAIAEIDDLLRPVADKAREELQKLDEAYARKRGLLAAILARATGHAVDDVMRPGSTLYVLPTPDPYVQAAASMRKSAQRYRKKLVYLENGRAQKRPLTAPALKLLASANGSGMRVAALAKKLNRSSDQLSRWASVSDKVERPKRGWVRLKAGSE